MRIPDAHPSFWPFCSRRWPAALKQQAQRKRQETRAGNECRGRIDAPSIKRHKRSDKGHTEACRPHDTPHDQPAHGRKPAPPPRKTRHARRTSAKAPPLSATKPSPSPSPSPSGSSQHSATRPHRPAAPVMTNFDGAASQRAMPGWMRKNAQKEIYMSATRSRIARTLIGTACIAAAAYALAWFAFRLDPGKPRERTSGDESYASSIEAGGNSRYVVESIVDIPFGQPYETDGLNWRNSTEPAKRGGTPDPTGSASNASRLDRTSTTPATSTSSRGDSRRSRWKLLRNGTLIMRR